MICRKTYYTGKWKSFSGAWGDNSKVKILRQLIESSKQLYLGVNLKTLYNCLLHCCILNGWVCNGTVIVTAIWDTTGEVPSTWTPEAIENMRMMLNSKPHLLNDISNNYWDRVTLGCITNELQSFSCNCHHLELGIAKQNITSSFCVSSVGNSFKSNKKNNS